MTISAVAFDVFGTLCHGQSSDGLLSWLDGLPRAERQDLIDAWMCGRIGYTELVRSGAVDDAPTATELQEGAEGIARTTTMYDTSRTVLEALQRMDVPAVCISNLAAPFGTRVREILSPWITGFLFSYEVGARKPDRAIFTAAEQSLGLPPGEILMVGDSIRSDIAGATQAGMPSLLISHRGKPDTSVISEVLECLRGKGAD